VLWSGGKHSGRRDILSGIYIYLHNTIDKLIYIYIYIFQLCKKIPAILAHHEVFLEELRKRLESWDSKQCVGGVFLETVSISTHLHCEDANNVSNLLFRIL